MRAIRSFFTFILGDILLLLIISLSLVYRSKAFVEKEFFSSAIKEALIQGINHSDMSAEEKENLVAMIRDKESSTIFNRAVQNFIDYKMDKDYNLSEGDYDLLLNYILKYKDEMNLMGETDYTESIIRDLLSYEEVNDMVKEAFDDMDGDTSSESVNKVVNIYTKVTSSNVKMILFLSILIVILLITLVNWSFFVWLRVTGVDLIICGSFMGVIYGLGFWAQHKIVADENIMTLIRSIDLKGFIIMAIYEILIGCAMLVGYHFIKRSNS